MPVFEYYIRSLQEVDLFAVADVVKQDTNEDRPDRSVPVGLPEFGPAETCTRQQSFLSFDKVYIEGHSNVTF